MVFRLLYRLLLQRLDRGAGAMPRDSTAPGRPGSGVSGPHSRRRRKSAVVVVGVAALGVAVLAVLAPTPPATNGGPEAALCA